MFGNSQITEGQLRRRSDPAGVLGFTVLAFLGFRVLGFRVQVPPWFGFGFPQKLSRMSSMFVPPEDKIPRPSPAGFWQRRIRSEGMTERPTRFPCVDFLGPLLFRVSLNPKPKNPKPEPKPSRIQPRHGHLPWARAWILGKSEDEFSFWWDDGDIYHQGRNDAPCGLRSRSLSPRFYHSSSIPEAWLTPERLPVSMRQGQGFLD